MKGRLPVRRKVAPKPRRPAKRAVRERLAEAEATLEAIRTGQVDAFVVSGPRGERTLTIDGATHPYFVLLNAMADGAALLEPGGAILFGNRSLGDMAGTPVESLRGSAFQRLVVRAERPRFEAFLREGSRDGGRAKVAEEFVLRSADGAKTPVAIALSTLVAGFPDSSASQAGSRDGFTVLMAIITDLTYRREAEAMRTGLLERLISAEDDERRRIARELHDETGQSLTALLVGLRAVADMKVRADVRRVVLQLRNVAAQTVDDVGRLARGLHPAVLDDAGLAAAATRYVKDYVRSFRTPVDFVAGVVDAPRLASLTAGTMYRILQEALTNVERHARAGKITVRLTRDHAAVGLLVRDNGAGFVVSDTHGSALGLGLRGMRERVVLLGGSIRIDSAPGRGTAVRVRIPTTPSALPAALKLMTDDAR